MENSDIFDKLFEVIDERKKQDAGKSYVSSLFQKGTEKINAKISEEAAETCEAALEDDHDHLVYEICDLLFHTFVLCGHKDIKLEEIRSELARRFGMSGHTEKANRKA